MTLEPFKVRPRFVHVKLEIQGKDPCYTLISAAFRLETAITKHSSAPRIQGHHLHEPSSIYKLGVFGANGAELERR